MFEIDRVPKLLAIYRALHRPGTSTQVREEAARVAEAHRNSDTGVYAVSYTTLLGNINENYVFLRWEKPGDLRVEDPRGHEVLRNHRKNEDVKKDTLLEEELFLVRFRRELSYLAEGESGLAPVAPFLGYYWVKVRPGTEDEVAATIQKISEAHRQKGTKNYAAVYSSVAGTASCFYFIHPMNTVDGLRVEDGRSRDLLGDSTAADSVKRDTILEEHHYVLRYHPELSNLPS